ncbi:M13 family metallopeptidase [Elongatibacter sediminis]|uniref:M13 family metallopeptidase n=1 Tax=Elongatibacter sediminis TaxID=3119006 RepID=A0AAW9R706_9GAMM
MASASVRFILAAALSAVSVIATADSGSPATRLPYTPSLDVNAMDRSADPCSDLYQFACGGWIENNPIPPDQASWSTYGKAYADNQRYLRGVLEELSNPDAPRTPDQARLGDYFAACMDLEGIDSLGAVPLRGEQALIDGLTSKQDLAGVIGRLIDRSDASAWFIAVGSQQDAREATRVIGAVFAAGLGLPDREYYLDDSPERRKTREAYREHVAAMFRLLGRTRADANAAAGTVWRIETALARAHLSVIERRDPYAVYHRMTLEELQAHTPEFDWAGLFEQVGLSPEPWLNVTQPAFVTAMGDVIERESLEALKTYLHWGLVNTRAPLLSRVFRDQDFAFHQSHLRGIDEQKPRWRTCVARVDRQLGEALGREFVERNFPPEVRQDVRRLTRQIQQAMAERIDSLGWMSSATRAEAHRKLEQMRLKIGYPDTWRDYSSIRIARDDDYGNAVRATEFDLDRQLTRIGQPVDLGEWFMTPATVNAYYNPSMNDINFPAGVLMPPLYDPKMDDAPNYGNTGGTIGHELVHGFDDEGRQFDGGGNLRDWWTPQDAAAFEERAQCIREQYGQYRVIDDILINAELTSGEDIADLGGLILAWQAWRTETAGQALPERDGLTAEQRFFVGFAQWACAAERPESLRLHAATDPHSPPRHRINGVVVNMPEFARAFQCPADAPLVKPPEDVCRIW